MKTLFILIPDALATKNYLRSAFWGEIKKRTDLRIVLLCGAEKAEEYRKEFGGEKVLVEVVGSVSAGRWEGVISFVARNALRTGHMRIHQMRNYIDFGGLPMLLLKSCLWLFFGRSSMLQGLIRSLDLRIPPPPRVKELFDAYRPDLVFSSSILNGSLDVAFLREAKRRGVHTIGIPRGWDNYTSKGILRVVPDTLLAMDRYLVEMGEEYQSLHKETSVVGFPGMDQYVDKSLIEPRDAFLSSIGVDPKKRMILFCALGDYSVPSEWEIAESFDRLVATGRLPKDLVMVYRAHPSFESHTTELASLPHVVHNRKAEYKGGNVSTWEMGQRDIAYYMNSIAHSEMVITTGSTAGIDAVAMDKPVISAAFENRPINYWLSARRFRKHFTHYKHLVETGGIATADSAEEMAQRIDEYMEDPKKDEEGRARAKARFLSPLDGGAGKRIAEAVLAHL